jgi:hypothetical protein
MSGWQWLICRDPEPVVQLIQAGLEVVLITLVGLMAALLAVNLGRGDALLVVIAGIHTEFSSKKPGFFSKP